MAKREVYVAWDHTDNPVMYGREQFTSLYGDSTLMVEKSVANEYKEQRDRLLNIIRKAYNALAPEPGSVGEHPLRKEIREAIQEIEESS